MAASTLRGTAPLTVNFSGVGSSDADGSVVAWAWNFGDGGSATGVTTSHSFATPGSYMVQLLVTDNSGLSAGSFVFTVTGVTRSGYAYQPASGTETRDAIAR